MTRRQCKLCPWRLDVDPADIPHGFNYEVHRRLGENIQRTSMDIGNGALHLMACHETKEASPSEKPCVGWLVNQLGRGNNLLLRIRAMRNDGFADVETVGPQRESYDEIRPNAHGDPDCDHEHVKPGLPMAGKNLEDRTEICCNCGAVRVTSSDGKPIGRWFLWEKYLALVRKQKRN